jgi:hypothetical protein
LIKTYRNNTKSNLKQLLDLIYMGVRLSGVDSSLTALLISTILCFRVSFFLVDIFAFAYLTSLFFCVFPHQPLHFKGVPSSPLATLLPLLSNSSSLLSSLLASLMLPFGFPPSRALAVPASPLSGCIVDIVAIRGSVPPPPREHAMWAWAMGKEGGKVQPHA